ncbi:unnamed protein product, partial [Choristocarpus tenellus]
MDKHSFEEDMKGMAVCAKCLEEGRSLLKCTGCRMVLYCCKEHQVVHWPEHKGYCKEMRKCEGASASVVPAPSTLPPETPLLPQRSGDPSPSVDATETYVSVCDGTGVFSVLGMFWKGGSKAKLCCLTIRLGQGVSASLVVDLPDWMYRTRAAAIKTLTVRTMADFVRVSPQVASAIVIGETTKGIHPHASGTDTADRQHSLGKGGEGQDVG